jgi:hypothetical protein
MMEAHLFENMGFEAKARLRKHAFRSSNWASTTLDHEMRFDMLALYMYLLPDIFMFAVIGLPSCNCWYITTLEICRGLPSTRNSPKYETAPKHAHSYHIISWLRIRPLISSFCSAHQFSPPTFERRYEPVVLRPAKTVEIKSACIQDSCKPGQNSAIPEGHLLYISCEKS